MAILNFFQQFFSDNFSQKDWYKFGMAKMATGGHGPPMCPLFGENVFENERIGSHRGVRWACPLDPPMQCITCEVE